MEIAVTTGFSHRTPVEFIVGAAERIEAAGFAALWVPEHVLMFPEYASRYPYSEDGKVPGNPDGVLDPFTALTFIAAHTSTLRLGTGICLVPQRQPVYTAKMVADLDYLSGGRVDFGIGVGWLEEEFISLGLDFSARGSTCTEYVDAMKALWGPDPVNFSGDTIAIKNANFNPKPVQSPHPPIFVGGESTPALRRVARFADGWYGFGLSPEELGEHLVRLDEHLEAAGRSRAEIKVCVCPNRIRVQPGMADAYAEAGADQLIVPIGGRNLEAMNKHIDSAIAATEMS